LGVGTPYTFPQQSDPPGIESSRRPSALTGADGTFELPGLRVSANAFLLVFKSPGFAPTSFAVGHSGVADVVMDRGQIVELRVRGGNLDSRTTREIRLELISTCLPFEARRGAVFRWDAATDASGRVQFRNVPLGIYSIELRTRNGRLEHAGSIVIDGNSRRFTIDASAIDYRPETPPDVGTAQRVIQPPPAGGHRFLVIATQREGGGPIPAVSIRTRSEAANGLPAERLLIGYASDGRFGVSCQAGVRYTLSVGRFNEDPQEGQELACPSSASPREIAVRLKPARLLCGEVVEQSSGAGIDGADVEAHHEWGLAGTEALGQVAVTDSSGKWCLDTIATGAVRLRGSKVGFAEREMRVTTLSRGGADSIRISLERFGEIAGTVRGMEADSHATVTLIADAGDYRKRRADVDSSGQFSFEEVMPARYIVDLSVANASGEAVDARQMRVEVQPGTVGFADFSIGDGVLLVGEVFLGRKLLPGASLVFEHAGADDVGGMAHRATADENGHYAAILGQPGRYVATLVPADESQPGCSAVELVVGDDREHDLHFGAAAISGRVVTADGAVVSGALVALWTTSLNAGVAVGGTSTVRTASARTEGGDGAFSFGPLTPGVYKLVVEMDGFAANEVNAIAVDGEGESDLGSLVLLPERSLTVIARTSEDSPLAGVVALAVLDGDLQRAGVPPNGQTGKDGVVTLKALAAGQYTILGLLPGYAPVIVDAVQVGRDTSPAAVPLVFSPGGAIEMQVLDIQGRPIGAMRPVVHDGAGRDVTRIYENLAMMSQVATATDEQGRLRLPAMRPGQYAIGLVGNVDANAVQVTVVEGHTSSVVITTVRKGQEAVSGGR